MGQWLKLPKSDLLWWIAPALVFGLWIGGNIVAHGTVIRDGYINPWFVASFASILFAVGLWFEERWARWVGFYLIVVWVIYASYLLVVEPFSWLNVVWIGCGVWCFWLLWQEPIGDSEDEGPFLSLVLLLGEPQYLEASILAQLATEAWGVEITGNEDEEAPVGEGFIVGASPMFICSSDNAFLLIHNFDVPYFDEPEEVADEVRELRVRNAILQHQAWLSVDFISGWDDKPPEKRIEDAYRWIAKLLAEIADENCLAIVDPDAGQVFVYDPETEEKLRSENPLAALREMYFAPVITVGDDDQEMAAAVDEACTRWPEFVRAFETRDDREELPFLIKAPFTDGDVTEFMWVQVTGIENDIIYGTLENEPADLPKWNEGDRVQVKVEDLNDWMCVIDNEPVGGFTMRVLSRRAKE